MSDDQNPVRNSESDTYYNLVADNDRLRAELAAERERVDRYIQAVVDIKREAQAALANVAKLREALVQARNATGVDERVAAFAAIDAVLKETGDE